jgi:hypothetical protein
VIAPQVGPTLSMALQSAFSTCARYRDEVTKSSNNAYDRFRGVRFFYADDAFGRDNMVGAQQAMEKLKLKPVAEV